MNHAAQFGSDTASPPGDFVLEARNIVREYPGTVALKGVTFRARRNHVNVLIGENGAGKSTLMKILAGAETPSAGNIFLNGTPIVLRDTRDATARGIAMVHQELAVLPNLDVSDNVFAGREITGRCGLIDREREDAGTSHALQRLRTSISTRSISGKLPLGVQQIVELARSLAHPTSVLILDEPTSALSRAESETLAEVIADLKRQGVTLIYVSHRLSELLSMGDFFTVLRDGEVVGEAPRGQVDQRWIVERMTGRLNEESARKTGSAAGREALSIHKLSALAAAQDRAKKMILEDVSFSAGAGEILGIYGLLGSGRTELLETIGGLRPDYLGRISIRGNHAGLDSPKTATNYGIALLPEDRKSDGIIETLSIRENISIAALESFRKGPFLSRRRELSAIRSLAGELRLKSANLEQPVGSLSGGNQQKVMLARALLRSPSILLMDEPTRGIDVGAKAELYSVLRSLAEKGMCVVFTSSDMEEIRALANRVLVLCRGRISRQIPIEEASDELLFASAASFSAEGAN